MGYEPALTFARPARLPTARGSLSEHVVDTLCSDIGSRPLTDVEPTDEDDEAITLFVLQELSYRAMAGVDPAWEEDASFLALRAQLERALEQRLRDRTATERRSDLVD